jgi:isopentenyl-diphosphate delta-isomerase
MSDVILVDENDNQVGIMEKMEAHEKGLLHRAFSIFIFNDKKELMLQKRANHKYHCGGLWTNTVCSHPSPEESLEDATKRRIQEEMGFECKLEELFHFLYRAEFSNGLIEHELDHVFLGFYNDSPKPNPDEVGEWKWISIPELEQDIEKNPDKYTPWFKKCLPKVIEHLNNK